MKSPRTPSVRDERAIALHVTTIREEADGVVSLHLRSAEGEPLPGWEPGAHIDLEVATGCVRQYSLCGVPGRDQGWRIAVLREETGRGGSQIVHDSLQPGDVLRATPPRNNFALVDTERYLFIAGGIGITPILPMVREVASRGRAWSLLYGGRTRRSMAFVEELTEVGGGEVDIRPEDEFGLLDLDGALGRPAGDTAVYCCGPAPLLDAVERRCQSWPAGALHCERFTSRAVASGGEFEVRLARSGNRLRVPVGSSLLEVLEEAGFEVTNSCRAGICGTCLLNVVDGDPEHRDDVLSDTERESAELILPCVSRSATDVLVIDL